MEECEEAECEECEAEEVACVVPEALARPRVPPTRVLDAVEAEVVALPLDEAAFTRLVPATT